MTRSLRSSSKKENQKNHNLSTPTKNQLSSLAGLKDRASTSQKKRNDSTYSTRSNSSRRKKKIKVDPVDDKEDVTESMQLEEENTERNESIEKEVTEDIAHNSTVIDDKIETSATQIGENNSPETQPEGQSDSVTSNLEDNVEAIVQESLKTSEMLLDSSNIDLVVETTNWKSEYEKLHEQFKKLSALRHTDAENLLAHERQLREEMETTHKNLVDTLNAEIEQLRTEPKEQKKVDPSGTASETPTQIDNGIGREIIELRKQVVDLQESVEQHKKSLDEACAENSKLRNQLSSDSRTGENPDTHGTIVEFYENLTSTKILSSSENRYELVSYNKETRKAIKFELKYEGDSISFEATGNQKLLPDFLQEEIEFNTTQLPSCFSKVLQSLVED